MQMLIDALVMRVKNYFWCRPLIHIQTKPWWVLCRFRPRPWTKFGGNGFHSFCRILLTNTGTKEKCEDIEEDTTFLFEVKKKKEFHCSTKVVNVPSASCQTGCVWASVIQHTHTVSAHAKVFSCITLSPNAKWLMTFSTFSMFTPDWLSGSAAVCPEIYSCPLIKRNAPNQSLCIKTDGSVVSSVQSELILCKCSMDAKLDKRQHCYDMPAAFCGCFYTSHAEWRVNLQVWGSGGINNISVWSNHHFNGTWGRNRIRWRRLNQLSTASEEDF